MLTFNFLSYTRTKASKDSIEKASLSKYYYAEDALIISFIRDENEVSPQYTGAIFNPKRESKPKHIPAHTRTYFNKTRYRELYRKQTASFLYYCSAGLCIKI